MEALRTVEDLDAAAREVRELQEQWRAAAEVPRAQADALWRRFKTAHDEVWARCEAHFASQAAERAENLARKTALCEQAEALSDSTDWIKTSEALKPSRPSGRRSVPSRAVARRRSGNASAARATSSSPVGTGSRSSGRRLWNENLARKEALCEKAEALAESTDWEKAAAEIRQLQAEWKTIGPVKKSRSEAIWQRFRGACDKFFTRYAQRHDTARAERIAAREAICAELEALTAAPEGSEPPADLLATARAFARAGSRKWRRAASIRIALARSISASRSPSAP